VNSSVFIDGNDLYYTKQSGKTKTFYKNKQKLFSLQSFYGHVVGADAKGVYFIANTKLGTGLFKFSDGKFYLLNDSDTIMDARLIDANHALVASIGADSYKYLEVPLTAIEQKPYEVKLFMEDKPYYKEASREAADKVTDAPKIDLSEPYYSLLDMVYSGTDLSFGSDTDAGFIYSFNINFADPLMQNQLSLFLTRNTDEFTLGGAMYENEQYFINYTISGYGVIDRPDQPTSVYSPDDKRDFGLVADAKIDFLEYGYNYGYLRASYYEDYTSNSRKPLSASVVLGNSKYFGMSMYQNFAAELQGYGVDERGDSIYGAKGLLQQGLPHEFFVEGALQYSKSDSETNHNDRGVKVAKDTLEMFTDSDPSSVLMYSLKDEDYYAKEVSKIGAKVTKVFNYNTYFFTFPLSLRRESLYGAYNHYEIKEYGGTTIKPNEAKVGMEFDTLLLNVIPLPMVFEYIYNDNDVIANKNTFSFRVGFAF
jgi:hypothetical protein